MGGKARHRRTITAPMGIPAPCGPTVSIEPHSGVSIQAYKPSPSLLSQSPPPLNGVHQENTVGPLPVDGYGQQAGSLVQPVRTAHEVHLK